MESKGQDPSFSMPATPRRFEMPTRPAPRTPISNFEISFPDSSSEEEEDRQEIGGDEEGGRSRLDLVGDDEEEDRNVEQSNKDDENQVEDFSSLFGVRSSIASSALRRQRLLYEGRENDDSEDGKSDIVMAFAWTGGRIGIAYYLLDTSELYILPDTAESSPDFHVLRSLFRQVQPRYLLVNASQDERLLKVACEICGENLRGENEDPLIEQEQPTEGSHLVTLQYKMFSPEVCKARLLSIRLPYERKNLDDSEHALFISSVIPTQNERMTRAAGALLQYLDKRGGELFQMELKEGHVQVLNIIPCTMDDIVMVDDSAWRSLQIFTLDLHPSVVKQADNSGSKEGISVFSMLKQACSTGQGVKTLRLMLLRPSRDIKVLHRRYDMIQYCADLNNNAFTKSAAECLKSIKNIPKLLHKLSSLHASVAEWKELYTTLYNCYSLGNICGSRPQSIIANISIFKEMSDPKLLDTLKSLCKEMVRVIDFEESATVGRIVAKPGIDPVIDTKKKQYACLPDIMNLVAREEMVSLPEFVHKCCVVYIPEVGYLLAVTLWREGLTSENIELEGLEFKFITAESAYYKTPRTKELDIILGDCSVAILQMETSIMICVTETILSHSDLILRVGSLVSEIDCLMSISAVARSQNFTRPEIVTGRKKLAIVNGRHPLVVDCDFVTNTTRLEGEERVVMVTGPNASGKSVYLKQVAAIVIMALSGSFVPASYAQIPLFDKIFTRIHATESVSSGLSSFMVDLSQMSMALRNTSKDSLIIIDEFGKGTAEADGLALLAASVDDFLKRESRSPTIFFTTHFYSLLNYISPSPVLKTQHMKFLRSSDGSMGYITFLYELVDGVCTTSLAHIVAEQTGIHRTLIRRSELVETVVRRQSEMSLVPVLTPLNTQSQELISEIGTWLLYQDLDDTDPEQIMSQLKHAFIL